jgi:hypothetical protein
MVASLDNVRGLTLAMSSSAFIGSSFVIKKVGLKKAGDNGVRAGCASSNSFVLLRNHNSYFNQEPLVVHTVVQAEHHMNMTLNS